MLVYHAAPHRSITSSSPTERMVARPAASRRDERRDLLSALFQPIATLIGSGAVLGAASVAYRGVLKTIRATDDREQTARREAMQERRRNESRAVVLEAMSAVVELFYNAGELVDQYDEAEVPHRDNAPSLGALLAALPVPSTKLRMYGFETAAGQVDTFMRLCSGLHGAMAEAPLGGATIDFEAIRQAHDALLIELRQAIVQIDAS